MAEVISRNRAALLVPVLLLRRVPRKKRKVAWQLIVPAIAGGPWEYSARRPGARSHWRTGVWRRMVVVSADYSSTNHCELRTVDGRDISPSLPESGGCRDSVSKGDEMRVRYDPEGVVSPDDGRTDSGGVRQSKWDRTYGDA